MNILKKHIFRAIAVTSLCSIVASCSQDDFGMIPDSERSLKLTTSVEGIVSRADVTGPWADGDQIRVRIKEKNSDYYPWIGKYALNTDGSVREAIDALAWPFPDGVVSAWYPFLKEGEEVSITDQSKGIHPYDFMKAETDRVMNYKETVNLHFKHQMAKVSCKLIKGDGVTDEDLKTAEIKYCGIPTVKFSEAGIQGVGSPDYITPASDYSALLVPQDVAGLPFITVDLTLTINDASIPKNLVYTPQETMNLEAGKAYTFNIKVQKDRLEVETISGAWTESEDFTEPESDKYQIYLPEDTGELGELEFSKNVTEKSADTRAGSVRCLEVLGNEFTISYKVTLDNCHLGPVFVDKNTKNQVSRTYFEIPNASSFDAYYEFSYKLASPISEKVYLVIGEHVEVGDYLFNDGKWGGIPKKIYESEDLPNEDKKTPVGIVFKVGAGGDSQYKTLDTPANYGWDETKLEIRGYAVALNDASNNRIEWGKTNTGVLDATVSLGDANIVKIKYSGFTATKNAKNKGIDNYPAFKAVIEYPSPAPEGSSGWYLPSFRQLTDIRNLFKHPQRRELITKAGGNFFTQKSDVPYCSASERSSAALWFQGFVYTEDYNANTATKAVNKTFKSYARGVLTF